MRIQNLKGSALEDGRLFMTWELVDDAAVATNAMCVMIATDSEFTRSVRSFLLPVTTGLALDTGPGVWYYRVGAVVGSDTEGRIDWSGTYPPVKIVSAKPVVPAAPSRLTVRGWEPTLEGVRLNTGGRETYYVFVDVSLDKEFRVGNVETYYCRDMGGKGFVDLEGSLKRGETYHLRIKTAMGDWSKWPIGRVETFSEGQVFLDVKRGEEKKGIVGQAMRGTVDAVTRQRTGTDYATAEANRVLLREARDKPVQRFSSHADYLRFVQAQTVNKIGR
jgi:hypothetical protein